MKSTSDANPDLSTSITLMNPSATIHTSRPMLNVIARITPSLRAAIRPSSLALLAAFSLCLWTTAQAQTTLLGWDFNGYSGYGPSPAAPDNTATNITAVGLTRGSGVTTTGTAATNGWGGNGWDGDGGLAEAVGRGDFATFSITANSGYSVSLSSIEAYNIRRSNTGPTTGQWQYQIGSGSFVNIGSAITWGSTTTATGNSQSAIDLTGIAALQNVAAGETVTFRIVNWGASAAGGTWYLNNFQTGNDLTVSGTVNVIPSNNSILSVPATSTFGRVMSGSSQSVTVSNAGDATTFGAATTGGFTTAATGSVTADGTSTLAVNVGSTLGSRSGNLTVTNTAADSNAAGQGSDQAPILSALSATVVQNRQLGRAAAVGAPATSVTENVIDVGKTLVGVTATGSGFIHTVGGDNENTRVTLRKDQTVSFSTTGIAVNLYTGDTDTEFNSASSTAGVTGDVNYATSGLKTTQFANVTAASGALTGEGLAGETVLSGRVYFRADVYQAASLMVNNGSTLGENANLTIANANTTDGGQRAGAEIVSRTLSGNAGWSVSGLAIGTTIGQNSGISGTATFDMAASGLLNGMTAAGSLMIGFQHADQSIQGTSANDLGTAVWHFETVVSGNNSGFGAATVAADQSFAGLGIESDGIGSAALLDGVTTDIRNVVMALAAGPVGEGVSANTQAISSYLSLKGTGTDLFVLSMVFSGSPNAAMLQWWDGASWVNAVDGNAGGTANFLGDVAYDRDAHFALGNYGYDSTTNTAWAVLNHNSDFVVAIPEPGTAVLLGLGLTAMITRRRRKG